MLLFGSLGFTELLLVVVLGVGGTIFWLWTLVHVVTKERDPRTRLMWVLVIALTHWVGALVYVIVRTTARRRLLTR